MEQHQFKYVLLGKFQTDNLEARFGQYIILSGLYYLVSVNEVLQCENILKVKILYTSSKVVINKNDFFVEFSDTSMAAVPNTRAVEQLVRATQNESFIFIIQF